MQDQIFADSESFKCFSGIVRSELGSRTFNLLTKTTPDFIPHTLWPPSSQDFNPADDNVWSVIFEKMHKEQIKESMKCVS